MQVHITASKLSSVVWTLLLQAIRQVFACIPHLPVAKALLRSKSFSNHHLVINILKGDATMEIAIKHVKYMAFCLNWLSRHETPSVNIIYFIT